MKKQPPLIAGLELEGHQFTLVVGHLPDRNRLVIRSVESIPAQGVQRGVLSDPLECTDAVARLVRQAEKSVSARIPKVLATLHGNHVTSVNTTASIPIADPGTGITQRDVERVIHTCRTLSLEYDRQILHAFTRGFSVDGQGGIKDPVGLYGTKLTIEMHLVTALNMAVQNLTRVLNRAGLEVERLVLPGLAAADAVLTDLDRDLGVTLIRIGESQTQALLFTDGAVRETFLIPWGTDHLMEALSRAFKLPLASAQVAFEQIRSLEDRPELASDTLQVKSGSLHRSIPQGQAVHLVASKCKEFLARIHRRLEESRYFRESASGIVMVGNLIRLDGFIEMTEGLLNMPVRLGTARDVELDPSITLGASHATAVGLLRYAAQSRFASSPPWSVSPWARLLERGRHLLEEYF